MPLFLSGLFIHRSVSAPWNSCHYQRKADAFRCPCPAGYAGSPRTGQSGQERRRWHRWEDFLLPWRQLAVDSHPPSARRRNRAVDIPAHPRTGNTVRQCPRSSDHRLHQAGSETIHRTPSRYPPVLPPWAAPTSHPLSVPSCPDRPNNPDP